MRGLAVTRVARDHAVIIQKMQVSLPGPLLTSRLHRGPHRASQCSQLLTQCNPWRATTSPAPPSLPLGRHVSWRCVALPPPARRASPPRWIHPQDWFPSVPLASCLSTSCGTCEYAPGILLAAQYSTSSRYGSSTSDGPSASLRSASVLTSSTHVDANSDQGSMRTRICSSPSGRIA